jgi:hypothetical protein
MSAICDRPEQPLAVDLRLDCSVALPQAVVREAEAAASALMRLTAPASGRPPGLPVGPVRCGGGHFHLSVDDAQLLYQRRDLLQRVRIHFL